MVLCEGDRTFRAYDIEKLLAYAPHADIVNGTRTVEPLRQYLTQLTTFMFYGNMFVGKLLEAKHLGRGTITDVGTTYKLCRREAIIPLLPKLKPSVNLEFNAHFLDTALDNDLVLLECPITFHPRVGLSKGGNVNNWRGLQVGLRMIVGSGRRLAPGMSGYHASRLTEDPRRGEVWRALWRYFFSHRIGKDDCVLDLGAGYGDFINNVEARRRIAVDAWDGMRKHLAPGVEAIVGPVQQLDADRRRRSRLCIRVEPVRAYYAARSRGRAFGTEAQTVVARALTILQPNYRYAYREYFDDYTHISIYSHISLPDFLRANGWEVLDVQPRFLPLTVKSRLPTWPLLVAAYLRSPFKPMGKQMLVVARPVRP